jgi:multicomponent Na+:H+ antiporter subunit E
MRLLLWNLTLALVWAAGTGSMTVLNLGFGFAMGFAVLWLARERLGPTTYFQRWRRIVGFGGRLTREIVVANLRVAHDIVTPTPHMRPGIIAIPLDARSDEEITLLANVISLTPGTLALDISEDRRLLYIHAMFIHDRTQLEAEIKQRFERRLLEILR